MSNATQRPNRAKTKSAPKKFALILALISCLLIVAGVLLALHPGTQPAAPKTLKVGSGAAAKSYKLENVSTDSAREKGLSGRSSLAADSGMVFTFDDAAHKRCIWMKDMKFSIDVIWLNADKRIVSAISNLSPSTYPQQYCAVAGSVVELPAGTIREQGLRPGQIVLML